MEMQIKRSIEKIPGGMMLVPLFPVSYTHLNGDHRNLITLRANPVTYDITRMRRATKPGFVGTAPRQ